MTSVALLIPSTKLSLQPYLLSNLDFVTESLTFIAGTLNVLFFCISISLKTPVVVSSDRPLISSNKSGNFSCINLVKSPPSSKIRFGFQLFGPVTVCSIHHQNSSSVSPFHAKMGISDAAIAAAAWSCVEYMLHELHLIDAPRSIKVSIKTAV